MTRNARSTARSKSQWWNSLSEWRSRLEDVTDTSRGIRASCPAHDDTNPSLDVDQVGRGVRWKCRAGCDQMDIVEAIDNTPVRIHVTRRAPAPTLTVVPDPAPSDARRWLAAKCSTDVTFIDSLPIELAGSTIRYTFDGLEVAKTRVAGSKDFRWEPAKTHAPPVWPLLDAMPDEAILTEGETDAIALRALGYEAFAVTKGAGAVPSAADLAAMRRRGLRKIYVGFDADAAGRAGESDLIAHALEAGLDVASIVPPDYDPLSGRGKDWCDWRAAGNEDLPLSSANDPMVGPDEFARLYSEKPDPVISGWLQRGGILMIVAPPKEGKSSLAFGMAAAAERSGVFAGEAASQMGSIWLTEEGFDTWQEKVERYGLADYRAMFRHVAHEHGLTFEAAVSRAASRAAREDRILVVDTIASWAGLESEADSGAVNAAMSIIRFAVVPRGVPCIVIHQTNRGGQYRGSTEFLAQADAMAEVSRTGAEEHGDDARAVRVVSRFEGATEPVVLTRDGGEYAVVGTPRITVTRQSGERARRLRTIRDLLADEPRTKEWLRQTLGVSTRTIEADLRDLGATDEHVAGSGNQKIWSIAEPNAQSNAQSNAKVRSQSARSTRRMRTRV